MTATKTASDSALWVPHHFFSMGNLVVAQRVFSVYYQDSLEYSDRQPKKRELAVSLSLCVLGSGSSGNCTYVGSENTHILIDAGLSFKETIARLDMINVSASSVSAICVTHEHSDHRVSLGTFSRRMKVELYANSGTIQAIEQDEKLRDLRWNVFSNGVPFAIGDVEVLPFSVPHDSYDPVGFIVAQGKSKVGIVTDMGMATGVIRERLKHCEAVVIEANYDADLLKNSGRPWSLKQRILGRQGHLSNSQAGVLLSEIACGTLHFAFLAHISSECNKPDLALATICRAMSDSGHTDVQVKLTYPDKPGDMVTI